MDQTFQQYLVYPEPNNAAPDTNGLCANEVPVTCDPASEDTSQQIVCDNPDKRVASIADQTAATDSTTRSFNSHDTEYVPVVNSRKRIPPEKLIVLEEAFQENPKPDKEARTELANAIDLPMRNIQVCLKYGSSAFFVFYFYSFIRFEPNYYQPIHIFIFFININY